MNESKLVWLLIIAVSCSIATLTVVLSTRSVKAADRHPYPRFEHIYTESGDAHILRWEVFHDRETGQEIVCAFPTTTLGSAEKTSCWLTGRNWK